LIIVDILLFQVLKNFSDYSSQIVTRVASGGHNTPEVLSLLVNVIRGVIYLEALQDIS